NPSAEKKLAYTRLPCAGKSHSPGATWIPPWQCTPGGGVSVSGKSCVTTPHPPLWMIRLSTTESYAPPEISTPVPIAPASPKVGTFGLLLFLITLCSMKKQDVAPPGHAPFCGGGASSLFSEFGTIPARLRLNNESLMTSGPPALVPEEPRLEFVPVSRTSVAWHTCWHAPTQYAASAILLAQDRSLT